METKKSKDTKRAQQAAGDAHSCIELRSEKVRNIIGEIPPALVRWGIAIMVAVFLLLFAAVLCLKFPYGHGETILQHILS